MIRSNSGIDTVPLPKGLAVVVDPDTVELDQHVLFGGSPSRMIRLSTPGRVAFGEIQAGRVESGAARVLGRKLTDAGLAHPDPVDCGSALDITVLIPTRDRADSLDRTLASLDPATAVIVVDDGSTDGVAVAEVSARHGAALVVRPESGGPGEARNTGLEHVTTKFVAFLDSDCVAPEGWLNGLTGHFVDPMVAAVAPRVVAAPSATTAGRYGAKLGPLDMGARPARVMPGASVGYVPTAALVVRRTAIDDVSRGPDVFDPALRYGEDVDLIWRLDAAGWRIRFDPSFQVLHAEPDTWRELLARRFRYGTSAAPLSSLHPEAISPLVLYASPSLVVGALLSGKPRLAAAGFAASVGWARRTLRSLDLPTQGVVRSTSQGVHQTWLGMARYATQFGAPALTAAALVGGGRRPWIRRMAAASLLLGPPVSNYLKARPAIDPARFVLGHVADNVAYGTGVWAGCVRGRTIRPLCPRPRWHQFGKRS